jgi:hypothetical protein
MPSWMLITHNALEFLFTPGRVTILGESDGNRLRRIYTDGRGHPADPDPTFHGHSIGHWENDTLVVDTVGVLPETYIAVSEAVGVPNNGDLHVIERIHLEKTDILRDDLQITAPHVLTKPWKTSRFLFRQRARKYDIVEGVCLQGNYAEGADVAGNAVFVPVPQTEGGNALPPEQRTGKATMKSRLFRSPAHTGRPAAGTARRGTPFIRHVRFLQDHDRQSYCDGVSMDESACGLARRVFSSTRRTAGSLVDGAHESR